MSWAAIIAIVAAVISAASSGAAMYQQKEITEEKAESAKEAAEMDMRLLEERQEQTQDAAVAKQRERQLQGMRERAKLDVAFANAGITGNTPLRQLQSSRLMQSKDMGQIQTNASNELNQIEAQQEAIATQASGRMAVAESRTSSSGMATLEIGSSAASGAASGYSTGKSIEASSGTSSGTDTAND